MNRELLFDKFVLFVQDLNEVFGQKTKSIKMYNIVLQKMVTMKQEGKDITDKITQHVNLLQEFLNSNKESILKQDTSLLVSKQLKYSDSIYIDVDMVLHHSEEKSAIWKHLLFLQSLVDPNSNAQEVLGKLLEDDSEESKLIKNIASKLESSDIMGKLGGQQMSSNPFDMIQTLTSSGIMDSLMGSVTGDIQKVNPKKLLGTMRNMLDAISAQIDDGEQEA